MIQEICESDGEYVNWAQSLWTLNLRGYRLSGSPTHLLQDIYGSLGNLTLLGCRIFFSFYEDISFPRQEIQVDETFVHENYTVTGNKANDIALLRLGGKSSKNQDLFNFTIFPQYNKKRHYKSVKTQL